MQNAQQQHRTAAQPVTPGQAARGTYRGTRTGVRKVTQRGNVYGPKHILTAELIIGLVLVLIRLVADYDPVSDGTVKGKVGHPQGEYGPVPVLAGLIATFWVLSFAVVKGGRWATFGNVSGGLIIIVLAMKSSSEIEKVAGTFGTWGKGTLPAGDWQTTGDPAGDVIVGSDGTITSGAGNASGSAADNAAGANDIELPNGKPWWEIVTGIRPDGPKEVLADAKKFYDWLGTI
jgi:hypothetical protein